MARFHIIKTTDPSPYESELIRFWNNNLPETAPGRLGWLREGNPAGPTTWFLAFDETRDVLAGTISVMPKTLRMNGRRIRSGIIGDLMVDKRYRVFGPAILLPKAVVNEASELGIEVLYTIPNKASAKIMERSAFKCVMSYESFVRPIYLAGYLDKYSNMSKSGAQALDIFVKFVTASMNRLRGEIEGIFNEDTHFDDSFEQLWEAFARKMPWMLLGERGVEYLRWRYLENPQYDFKVLTHRFSLGEPVSGYLVYSTNGDMINIFDLVSLEDDITGKLIRKLILIAQAGDCRAIYVTMNPRMPLANIFRRHLFINNRDRFELYCPAVMAIHAENWYFLAGDRNL